MSKIHRQRLYHAGHLRAVLRAVWLSVLLLSAPACKTERPTPEPPAGLKPPRVAASASPISDLLFLHPVPLTFRPLEEGLAYARLELVRSSDGSRLEAIALRVDPARFRFRMLSAPRELGSDYGFLFELVRKSRPLAAINASFYLKDSFEPTGLVVSSGEVLHPWTRTGGSGLFRVRGSEARIEWARTFNPEWEQDDLAVQSWPLLVEPGGEPGIYSNQHKRRARSAAGVDGEGRVILLCTRLVDGGDAETGGLDLYELMELLMLSPEQGGLGVPAALNLDGGTSASLWIAHPRLKLELRSKNLIRNAIAVFRKTDPPPAR